MHPADTTITSEILSRQCDRAVPWHNRKRQKRNCRSINMLKAAGFQLTSQNFGGQSPRKSRSVLNMTWASGWTRWPPGLPSNLRDPMITSSLGLHVMESGQPFQELWNLFPCLQNTDTSRTTPVDHEILNTSEVFSQFTRRLELLQVQTSHEDTGVQTLQQLYLVLYKCLPAGKTWNLLLIIVGGMGAESEVTDQVKVWA